MAQPTGQSSNSGGYSATQIVGGSGILATAMLGVYLRNRAAQEHADILEENARAQVVELGRQQIENDELAGSQKADIVRRAERQLGAVRAAAAEAGVSQSSLGRLVGHVGSVEGRDLGTTERNRVARADALQSQKLAVVQEMKNSIRGVGRQAVTSNIMSLADASVNTAMIAASGGGGGQ